MYFKQAIMRSRIKSVRYAASGILYCIKNGVNFRIQLFAAALATAAGIMVRLSAGQWLCISACIMMVLLAEAFNTAIEKLCDLYGTAYNPVVKIIKDVSAGAVLLAACGSVITGLIIFIPAFASLLKNTQI
jgi:diacylglycerol kinase